MAEPYLNEEATAAAVGEVAASVIVEPAGGVAVAANALDGGTLPAAAMKFADLTESGSESGDGEAETGDPEPGTSSAANMRSSPPPNCAICLSRCRRKCFTDSCMHQFCFKCLCEWSKIKPECPLCKQPFKTIIHNVRTLDDYDRYPVQSSSPNIAEHSSLRFHIVNIRRPRYMPLLHNQGVMTNDLDGGGGGAAGGLAAAAEDEAEATARIHPSYNRFEPYRMELMNYYRHDQDATATSGSSLSQLWRRYVYDRKLYALPVSDGLTGHFREWSARFYRNNPAQMHRLMPWIHRDIVCLLRNAAHSVSPVMHLMHDILPMTNILGPTFRRRLTPFLGERTSHFIHELFNFARSPFDMIGYDRVVQYSARVAEEVEVDLLDMVSPQSSNGSEVHLEVESSNSYPTPAPLPSTSVIVTNPSATHSFSVTMAADGSEMPGFSIRRTTTSNVGSQTVAINLSMRRPTAEEEGEDQEVIEIDDGEAAANAEVAAINDHPSRRHAGSSLPVSAHIELQSSDCSNSSSSTTDEDECVFVLERKPPHLRTPELVSLDSNSDSDVVFVDEQKAAAGATDSAQAVEQAVNQVGQELFMGPSTSSGVCSTTGKNWKMVLQEARRQDELRGRAKRSSRRRMAPPPPSSSSSSSCSSSSSSNKNWSSSEEDSDSETTLKRRRRKARKLKTRKRKAQQKIKKTPKKRSKREMKKKPEKEKEEEPEEEEKEEQKPSSSNSSSSSEEDNSAAESSEAGDNQTKTQHSSSEDDDDDDDSTENLQLSALRATLKAEAALEDRKPLKLELPVLPVQQPQQPPEEEEDEDQAQPELATLECSAPKRRRSCSSSNLSTTTATSSADSTTLNAFKCQLNSETANDPLMRGSMSSSPFPDMSYALNELSTFGLFNEQEPQVVINSDVEASQFPLEPTIDVVGEGEAETEAPAETEEEDEEEEEEDDEQQPNNPSLLFLF